MTKNVICWFEIYVDDIERSKKFYSEVLKTSFEDADMPGSDDAEYGKMSFFRSDSMEAVSGALVSLAEPCNGEKSLSTMVYFPCEDCAVEESRVAEAGGKVFKTKMSIGEHGFCSICEDPEGNVFGLHSLK